MIQLFIFNEISRAAIYGIGTYIRQLIACLDDKFQINIVNYYSDKPELTIVERNKTREFFIPRNQLKYTEGKCDETYFTNSIYLLSDFIDSNNKIIFHFNHFRYEKTFGLLREYWPTCKIIVGIHYFNWCFPLNGNTSYFREIIQKNPDEITDILEKETLATYQQDVAFLRSADHIICLAHYAKDLVRSDYQILENKISLIYNGLKDEAIFLTSNEKKEIKKKLHIDPNEKIILFVGRLDDIKGIDYIIQAFKKLLQKRNDCHLIIVGDGEYSKCLQECKGDWGKILFTGKLLKEEVYQFYQIADIGIMLSKHEQCSFVAIEMMMHGLPIIASDSTGLDEMVSNKVNGYKIKTIENKNKVSFDTNECCRLLTLALNNTEDKKLRSKCRQQYETNYSLACMKEKMQTLYKLI